MGFFQKIIDFFLGLFGLNKKKEPAQLSAGDRAQIQKNSIQGLEHVQGAENIHVHGTSASSKVIKESEGAQLIEDDGEQQWCDRTNLEVPPQAWQDDWGPLGSKTPDTLATFIFHEQTFDMTRSGDPLAAEQKLLEFGYRSVGHFFKVRATILKHYGTQHGPTLQESVFDSQEYMNAGMKAAQMQHQQTMNATLAANPELMSPVEGCTVETYAEIAAKVASGLPQDQLLPLLASKGLDMPMWQRVNATWTDRMSKDTTATIATIYGKAFMNSGAGQYGAAAKASADINFMGGGAVAAGAEPITFDKLCEVQGAMSAWATTGQDVNALLQRTFNMNAVDWSSCSMWWMSRMTADLRLMDEYTKKSAVYEQKYKASQPKHDQDISF